MTSPLVIVHSIKVSVKILGHSVARFESRDGRNVRLVPLDQRLSIPLTYQGWFELLTEDGRSARPIDTVQKLARDFPSKCLVRQNVKAFMCSFDGKLSFDKQTIIPAGEQLNLHGEVTMTVAQCVGRGKFLKCTDSKGVTLFLGYDQKGLFTPIAGENDFTGVLKLSDITKRFRLPLTVRLVQGVWPKVESSRFTGIIRLDWAYTDENAFLCPLDKGNLRICPVPTEVPLKLVKSENMQEINESESFKNIMIKCNRMIMNYNNTIHLILSVPESANKKKTHNFANLYTGSKKDENQTPKIKRARSREDILMDETDDLYQYLRAGKQPPKEKYTRDSDEESFFEEPAYERLDDVRARLTLLENRRSSGYLTNKPSDTNTKFEIGDTSPPNVKPQSNGYGKVSPPSADSPPELPPRRYNRADSAPQIKMPINRRDSSGGSTSPESGSGPGINLRRVTSDAMFRRKSKDSTASGGLQQKPVSSKVQTNDAKSISSKATGSSGKRHSIHTMYL